MRVIILAAVIYLLMTACSGVDGKEETGCRESHREIKKAVVSHLLSLHESQSETPQHYCLGFDFSIDREGKRADQSFLEPFRDFQNVHPLEYCRENPGRLLSVGSVRCKGPNKAMVWSFTWRDDRNSGADCLHTVIRDPKGWHVQNGCSKGMVYN